MERFRDGTSELAGVSAGMEFAATEDHTVVFTLPAPDPSLLTRLAQQAFIASPASFDDPDVELKPIGSGSYILDVNATVPGTTYEYIRNPDY